MGSRTWTRSGLERQKAREGKEPAVAVAAAAAESLLAASSGRTLVRDGDGEDRRTTVPRRPSARRLEEKTAFGSTGAG